MINLCYTTASGKQRNALNSYLSFGNVVGGTPRAILAPGPDGAVATVQFEMLREGGQDTAVLIYLRDVINNPVKAKLLGARATDINKIIEDILDTVETGDRIRGAGDYHAMAQTLYELAAEVGKK